MASERPVNVARMYAGANSSPMVAGLAVLAMRVHRSGSLMNNRTMKATAAGIRPHRKT